jgi:hypothetical protein
MPPPSAPHPRPPADAVSSGPLTAVPEITDYAIEGPVDEFIIMGCDGLWCARAAFDRGLTGGLDAPLNLGPCAEGAGGSALTGPATLLNPGPFPARRDVFSSQRAVEFARSRLRRHNDPQRCAEELVAEALRMVRGRGGGALEASSQTRAVALSV